MTMEPIELEQMETMDQADFEPYSVVMEQSAAEESEPVMQTEPTEESEQALQSESAEESEPVLQAEPAEESGPAMQTEQMEPVESVEYVGDAQEAASDDRAVGRSETSEDAQEEKKYKAWLVKEQIRMESERRLIRQQKEELLMEQQKLEAEKKEFGFEMKRWKDKIHFEKTRMDQERNFFDTKFKILENGFKQLAAEKEQFEYEKKMFETMKKVNGYHDDKQSDEFEFGENGYIPVFFFKGVTSPLGLKKRYKDLIKIFHPDNLFGDHDTILKINKEYEMMKKKFNYQKKTV